MGSSSIFNPRSYRYQARTWQEQRGPSQKQHQSKNFDAPMTAHNSDAPLPAQTGEPSKTDHKIDHIHEVIRDQLATRLQTLSANAVLSDRRPFFLYRLKTTGRRCSCYAMETSPSKQCAICYGSGLVGGYDKFGTVTEVLDYTSPNLMLVNVDPTLGQDTRPVFLQLSPGYNKGFAEAVLPIKANIGSPDTYLLGQPIFNRGARIRAFDPDGNSAYINGPDDWIPFLAFPNVRVRVELTKINNEKSIFSHLFFRYQITDPNRHIVYGDVPRAEETISSSQFGFMDIYQELGIFFDGKTIASFQNEDILYRITDGLRFKIVMTKVNRVATTVTSWDIRCRYLIKDIDSGLLSVPI